jgi:colanic acid/amylovoran biosynthesis glycosyltransferase
VRADGSKKCVVHLVHEYLGHTSNWIYTQIKYMPMYEHSILTTKILNLNCYNVDSICKPIFSGFPLNILDRVSRRLGFLPIQYHVSYSNYIKKYKPNILFAHFGWDGYFALGLKNKFKIPLITRFYGYDIGILPRMRLWQIRYRQLFAQGDLFIVEGHYMKSALVQLGCPESKIAVHHLGIELDLIPYAERSLYNNELKILIAATFKEKKGLEYALRSLRHVIDDLAGIVVSIKIIGDGPLSGQLHTVARELGLESYIQWMGYQAHSVFIKELGLADIFLSPSVEAADGDTEGGAPVALLEAQASGIVVVSTFHADIPEVVINEKTGLLVRERDVDGLTQALLRLAKEKELYRALSIGARNHVMANHDAEKQGALLGDIISGLF